MASLMSAYAETGIANPKFVRRRLTDGAFWSTVAVAFEAYNAANIANYGITAVEVGVTGVYTASDPAETIAGDYLFLKSAGASLVVGDLTTGLRWQDNVSIGVSAATISTQVASDLASAHGAGSWATATGFSTLSAAQVNAEMVDVIRVDTIAEPTGAPAATATFQTKVDYIYEALRNKLTVTASAKTFFNDAGVSQWSKTLSDDGTTYLESEGV